MAALLVTLCASVRAEAPALQLERTIPLPDVTGRIDHMAIDLGRRRLFVAELGNNTVDVIDLASGKAAHRIEGLREPQGIGYAPKADVIAIANAGDGSVRLFRGADFAPLGTVALGSDADNIRPNADSGQIVVGYGEGGLATIDPASGSVVARAKPLRALRPTPPRRTIAWPFRRKTRACPSTVMRYDRIQGETCQPMTMKTRCCCNPSRPWCQAPHLSSGLSSVVLPVNYTDLCMR